MSSRITVDWNITSPLNFLHREERLQPKEFENSDLKDEGIPPVEMDIRIAVNAPDIFWSQRQKSLLSKPDVSKHLSYILLI